MMLFLNKIRRLPPLLAASLGVSLLAPGCGTPGNPYFMTTRTDANVYVSGSGNITKVALMPFKAPTELIGASVSDLFVTEILRSGKYTLVERSQMSQVLNESELALAGLSTSRAVEIGSMLGADGVIIGTVSEYGTAAKGKRAYPVVGASVRLIDVSSGQIVWSVDHSSRSTDKDITLPEHARVVVHEMMAGVYQQWQKRKR